MVFQNLLGRCIIGYPARCCVMADLLAMLRQEATSRVTLGGPAQPWPPASGAEIRAFEQRTRTQLPALWREIFTSIGNGGFGPGYGIYGLITGAPDDQVMSR